jgi:hypothetical protein
MAGLVDASTPVRPSPLSPSYKIEDAGRHSICFELVGAEWEHDLQAHQSQGELE